MPARDDRNKDRYLHHKLFSKVLREWYGYERGRAEMLAYCPDTVSMGGLLDWIMAAAMSEEQLKLMKLKENWPKMMGLQLAGVCEPGGVRDGVVEIEVSHPAWIRELRGPVRHKLLENIAACCGADFCRELRFVPRGRQAGNNS